MQKQLVDCVERLIIKLPDIPQTLYAALQSYFLTGFPLWRLSFLLSHA